MRHDGKRVMHERIEAIYMFDPNGYNLEVTRKLRPLGAADERDTELSIRALIDVTKEPDPTMAKLWERKGALIHAEEQVSAGA